MTRLQGKVALVTGASSGIGEAAAKALAAQGASVVLAARRADPLERVAKEIQNAGGEAIAVRTDVTVDEDLANAVHVAEDRFGGLDVAFNNAGGMGTMGLVADQDPAQWATDLSLVLTSTFLSMRQEIPALQRRGGGVIVNNASQLGVVGFGAGISSYVAGKHGVVGLTKAAALEYAPRNIRVNSIHPGPINTPMLDVRTPEQNQRRLQAVPMKRRGAPEEVADLVLFLISDESRYITGAEIAIDGGATL